MTSRRLLTSEAKLLLDAADRLEEHGWCQGVAVDRTGRMCVVGAVSYHADKAGKIWPAAVDRIQRQIDALDIAAWNDAPGRTQDEVVSMLREAAIA